MATIHVDVINAEHEIFSGNAEFVALPSEVGGLDVLPDHMPLATRIRLSAVHVKKEDGGEEFVFVAGGILEVQPKRATVLANTTVHGRSLDEAKANEARRATEEALQNQSSGLDLARAQGELTVTATQLTAITRLRRKR